MKSRQRILILILATANLVVIGYLFGRSHLPAAKSIPEQADNARRLPLVELRNDEGRIMSSSKFIGSPLFVQFVNPDVDQQIESVNTILSDPPHSPTSFLFITSDARTLRKRLHVRSEALVVVEDRDYQLRDAFDAPRCCERWLLFDAQGKFSADGAYDAGNARSELLSVADRKPVYSTQMLLAVLGRLNEGGRLEQLHSAKTGSRSRTAIVAMFSSVCTGCATGTLVDLLNSHARKDINVSYLALVPGAFNRVDVDNLKVNLGLCFPVELANTQLSSEWLSLNQQYGEKAINGSVIAFRDRKIVSVVNGIEETRSLLNNLRSSSE